MYIVYKYINIMRYKVIFTLKRRKKKLKHVENVSIVPVLHSAYIDTQVNIRHGSACVLCTLHVVQCTLYCTLYIVQCTLDIVQCTLYSVHCSLFSVQCTQT